MFNNVSELSKWIQDYIAEKGKRSLHIALNNSKTIKEEIKKYTSYLPESSTYNQRCYHIITQINEIPKCKHCGINYVSFNNRNKDWKYLDYCSSKCGRINQLSIDKYKNTAIKKWGVDNYSKTQEFRDRIVKINNDRYGVDWYQQSLDFKEKSIISCLAKYGFDRYSKTDEFKEKIRKTFLTKYGVDWYTKTSEFKEKFKITCLSKYGYEHFLYNDIISFNFKKQFKNYTMPSGKIYRIQGYENIAIDELLKYYKEDDLIISNVDIKKEIGVINYLIEESDRIYMPDIYIKSENKIIEVKSNWTYNLEVDKNNLKKNACIESGMKFEFWIIDRNKKIKVI